MPASANSDSDSDSDSQPIAAHAEINQLQVMIDEFQQQLSEWH
jgi:hypothetical protein